MSLVVARKEGRNIFLIGDTKLSSVKDEKLWTSLYQDNVLKIVIINQQLVIAFAGGVSNADIVIKSITPYLTKEEIIAGGDIIRTTHSF